MTLAVAAEDDWRMGVATGDAEAVAAIVAMATMDTKAAREGSGGVLSRTPSAPPRSMTISPRESPITTYYWTVT